MNAISYSGTKVAWSSAVVVSLHLSRSPYYSKMSSFAEDGWGDDEDLNVSATSLGNDGWGEDDDFFGNDVSDEKEDDGLGFPPAAPSIPTSNQISEAPQPLKNQVELNTTDGWGEDDDFFDDDSDDKAVEGIGFPSSPPSIPQPNQTFETSQHLSEPEISNANDGWGEDDDFFDDDSDDKEVKDIGFPSAAPSIPQSYQPSELAKSIKNEEELNKSDGWGDDNDFFDDDSGQKEDGGIDFPPAAPGMSQLNETPEVPQPSNDKDESNVDDGWGDDDDFFDEDSDGKHEEGVGFTPASSEIHQLGETFQPATQSSSFGHPEMTNHEHSIPMQESRYVPPSSPMVTELSKYIQSLDRMLSSINAVLEFEYNTPQKAEELFEYYDKRPQLAEYTRTKELQRMNYEIFLPDGYVETNKEQIVSGNLLPDNAIVSRAANQSLLADVLQVITGHDLIVRPQYLASCIATSCKFIIHKGDHGVDMIDCRAILSLFLPTVDGDRLNVAEVTVSVVFAPSQPMIEFRVVKIEVVLKDYSKLSGVAEFLRAMDIPVEDHEIIDAPPDMYRDAFLEKSQRLFALSSVGMKSAFQQMDSVINLKGKMKSISSFIPDTDQLLAAEQEAAAFAEARRIELQRVQQLQQQQQPQHREHAFPRPPPPEHHHHQDQMPNETKRPKSILGGLVRSGWKTLASSVAIPDDDPDIYGEYAPSQPPRASEQPMKFYRTEEPTPPVGIQLYRTDEPSQKAPNANEGHQPQTHIKDQEPSKPERISETETNLHHDRFVPENQTTHGDPRESLAIPSTDPTPDDVPDDSNIQAEMPVYEEEKVGDNEFDDGWDDGLDGFDDLSDNLEELSAATKPDQEKDTISPDIVMVDSFVPTDNTGANYSEEDDVCETRRRWVNPRPHRPYLKYLLP